MFAAINKTHEEVVSAVSDAIHDALVRNAERMKTPPPPGGIQDFGVDVCEVDGLVQIDMTATCRATPGPDGWISIFMLTEHAKEVDRLADTVRELLYKKLSLGAVTTHQGSVSLRRITKRANGFLEVCCSVRFTIG